jgi:flagellar motor switch protein FliM
VSDSTGAEKNPFQHARLLTPDRVQLISRTAETLATELEEELARWLSDVTVTPGAIEQTTMAELTDGTRDLAVIKAEWAMTHGALATDLQLALSIVAMLCGGVPNPPPEPRPLSRLEMGVFDLLIEPFLRIVVNLFDIGESHLGVHTSHLAALPDSQNEPAIAVPMQVKIGSTEGVMTVCMSATQVQDYLEELDRRIAGRTRGLSSGRNRQIVEAVRPVAVELVAGFEPMQVPAQELVGLQVGDVLRTRQSITRPLVARVGGQRVFYIRPSQQGQRLVAELTGHADDSFGTQPAMRSVNLAAPNPAPRATSQLGEMR